MSDFTSEFWSWYVAGLTLLGGEPFEPANQPAVADLLRQRAMWEDRRRTARIFVETHRNWSSNILRYEPVYQRLLSAKALRTA